MQPGQFLINKDGRKCKVLGVCGEAIFTSKTENFDESDSSICTLAELKKFGWSLLEEPKEPKFIKITKDTFKDLNFEIKIKVEDLLFYVEEPWVPGYSEDYWYVSSDGNILFQRRAIEDGSATEFRISAGNAHKTAKDAELYKQKLIERMEKKNDYAITKEFN